MNGACNGSLIWPAPLVLGSLGRGQKVKYLLKYRYQISVKLEDCQIPKSVCFGFKWHLSLKYLVFMVYAKILEFKFEEKT